VRTYWGLEENISKIKLSQKASKTTTNMESDE